MIQVESMWKVDLGEMAKLQFGFVFLVQIIGEAVKFNEHQIASFST